MKFINLIEFIERHEKNIRIIINKEAHLFKIILLYGKCYNSHHYYIKIIIAYNITFNTATRIQKIKFYEFPRLHLIFTVFQKHTTSL